MRRKRAQKSRIIMKLSVRQVQSRRGPEALISLPLTLVLMDGKPPKNSPIGEDGRLLTKKSMVASKQEDAYEEEKEKVTASQVTTIYAIWIFYYLITFFSFYGGNYDSTI
jgi:hypothetical protein